jgi:mannose-6-phosphate isomerase
MSVVSGGMLDGQTLADLVNAHPRELVGEFFTGDSFPLLIKIIDANDRLSVQVHPDDKLARELGVADRGKTECWYMLGDGGELFQGCKNGVTRTQFASAIVHQTVEDQLNHFETSDGDFFFMPARTVHALGRGCLLFEIQQNCDCTFRVYDWGRVGLDGQPRELHIEASLQTINFDEADSGPIRRGGVEIEGVERRLLADCPYFSVEELRGGTIQGGGNGRCSIVMNIDQPGIIKTEAGSIPLQAMATCLVPAIAGQWTVQGGGMRLLHAQPV